MTFELTDKEIEKYEEWKRRHGCKGTHTFLFIMSGIGVGVKLRCSCGPIEYDLTDYGSW